MAGRGELEQAVLQVLWDNPDGITARDAMSAMPDRALALTTVMTVLGRLCQKGLAVRDELARPHLYRASATREEYIADIMLDALGQAPDREAALARFLGSVSDTDTDHLRRALRLRSRRS